MRNLKRALSLTLASVMLLGMMVVGGSAAEGYPDVDESQNVEAIEVLQAVGVMGGDNNGNFNPDDYVTREQMAVIMSQLLKLDYNYYKGTNPFSDVPEWAAPYVAACAANGITAGIGDGLYGSKQNIQAVQAALMMLKALGYFQYAGDYEGGYVLATVKQATEVGLFKGIDSESNTDLTRNQIAQMVLNTLQADMVRFTGDPGITYTGSNGESWVGGYKAEYTPRTSTDPKYDRLIDNKHSSNIDYSGQYYIQLGEELYDGKLTKKFVRDDFERPSYNWQFDGKEIGTYVDYTLKVAEYTKGVTGETVYDKLTYTTINDNALLNYVDGVAGSVVKNDLVRSNKSNIAGSGTGVLTEIFVDRDREEVTITSINTYLAKANSDYNETNETVSLRVFMTRASNAGTTKLVDSDDVPAAADVVKDEYMLVYMSGKESASNTKEVVRIFDIDILTDTTVTEFSKDNNKVVDSLTADGTSYSTNVMAFYNYKKVLDDYDKGLLTDMSYNLYLDRYGNIIGVDLYEGTKNYVFITGYDRIQSNISIKTAQAAGIFLDGTMDTMTVNVTDTNKNIAALNGENANYEEWSNHGTYGGLRNLNRWYTYTVSTSGVYTLKPTDMMYTDYKIDSERVLDSAHLYLDDSRPAATKALPTLGYKPMSRIYGNDDSIYITVETGKVDTGNGSDAITEVNGVYTGIQNVKLELTPGSNGTIAEAATTVTDSTGTYVYSVFDDSDGYVIASIVLGDAQGSANNYAYILGEVKSERIEDGTYYWKFDAVVDGVKTTLTAKTNVPWSAAGLKRYHVQELRYDGDYVTSFRDVKTDKIHTDPSDDIGDSESVYDVGHVVAASATGKKTHTGDCSASSDPYYDDTANRLEGTISFDGRTLVVERGTTDVGLAVRSDCKAVLVQYENGKSSPTVQNCADLYEAISRLADADTSDGAPGTQFKGRIVAGIDNNRASWVVIISDTELISGQNNSYTGNGTSSDGSVATVKDWDATWYGTLNDNSTAYVTGFGRASWNFSIAMPEWVDAAHTTAVVDYDVYVGDVLYEELSADSAVAGNGCTVSGTNVRVGNTSTYAYPTDKGAIRIVVNSVTYDSVVVEYKTNIGGTIADAEMSAGNNYLAMNATGMGFTLDSSKYDNAASGKYTVSGVTPTVSGSNLGSAITIASGSFAVKGGEKVVVTFTDITAKAPTYTVATQTEQALSAWKSSYAGVGKDLAFAQTANPTTAQAGQKVALTITPKSSDTLATTEASGVKVVFKMAGEEFEFIYPNNGTTKPSAVTKVVTMGNANIEAATVEITPINPPAIANITVDDVMGDGKLNKDDSNTALTDSITIYFNEAVKPENTNDAPALTSTTLTFGTGVLSPDGKSATYKVTGDAADGTTEYTVTIAANKIEGATNKVSNGGVVTFKIKGAAVKLPGDNSAW